MSIHTTVAIIPPGTVVFVRQDPCTVIRQQVVDVRITKEGTFYNVQGKLRDAHDVYLTAEVAFRD